MDVEINYDLNTFLADVSLDYKLTLGPGATGDTKMDVGDVVSGSAYYYFIDDDGVKHMKSGRYYFNSGVSQGISVFSSPDFSVYGVSAGSGSTPVSLNYTSSSVYISGGSHWVYEISLDNYSPRQSNSCGVTFGTGYPTFRSDISQGFTAPWVGATGGNAPAYTTSRNVHNSNHNVPYLPISGQNLSYNDIRALLVDLYNEQNPEETISINDLPEFDEQDNTEPSYDLQPFSIDYNEILGEREMESIIAETRYILDTTPYEIESFDYMLEASAPYEILKDAGTLSDGLIASVGKVYDLADDVVPPEIISLYAFLAFLGVGMWFLLRR